MTVPAGTTTTSPSTARLAPGFQLGDFRIGAPLWPLRIADAYRADGPGGRATLYAVHARIAQHAGVREHLIAGARTAAALAEHRHLTRTLAAGLTGDILWIATEEIDGSLVRELMAKKRQAASSRAPGLGARATGNLMTGVAAALADVQHGALASESVAVSRTGRVRVVDLALGPGTLAAITAGLIATPGALAPESAAGAPPSAAADVYALGALLYEALVGRPLERGGPRPSEIVEGLNTQIDEIVVRACHRDPTKRFGRAEVLGEVVAEALHKGGALQTASVPTLATAPTLGEQASLASEIEQGAAAAGGADRALAAALADTTEKWLIGKNRMDYGPFSLAEVITQIERGDIVAGHYIQDKDTGARTDVAEHQLLGPIVEAARQKRDDARRAQAEVKEQSRDKKRGAMLYALIGLGVVAAAIAVYAVLSSVQRDDDSHKVAGVSALDGASLKVKVSEPKKPPATHRRAGARRSGPGATPGAGGQNLVLDLSDDSDETETLDMHTVYGVYARYGRGLGSCLQSTGALGEHRHHHRRPERPGHLGQGQRRPVRRAVQLPVRRAARHAVPQDPRAAHPRRVRHRDVAMPTAPRQSQKTSQIRPPGDSAPELSWRPGDLDSRSALARAIPRRRGVSWWLGIVLALGFAALVTPAITAEHWLLHFDTGTIAEKHAAPFTVRAPMTGYGNLRIGGGVVVARGEIATRDEAAIADAIAQATPRGPLRYAAFFALTFVLAALFTHHMRRSNKGRLLRVQIVSLAVIAVLAAVMKAMLLITALSALVVPLAVLAMVPTIALDRIVGLATGVLAALVICLLAPFDIGLALLLLVQAATAGLVIAEAPRRRWLAALTTGLVTTACTSATYLLLSYLTSGHAPELRDPLHSPWLAAGIGPALAALLTPPMIPIYQLLVGEITQSKLFALEDLGHPLLRQIAEKAPGTWQHSLMMANMAEIAANAIGANGRLVRVGAYFHDLGKSLSPRYFIENLEAGETSPHDLLPPEVSCDAIFGHVTEGIVAARKAGLHERIVDFMHMHHGNGVLEYFWSKCREQNNPNKLTVEHFRYPGVPPQSRETAILAICDAVEAASRTLRRPDQQAIGNLVQRIVYGKLHLGQLDESGLSMADLRKINDSLRETIKHAHHGRIEYPWQKAQQDASASFGGDSGTQPRLDSLDRRPRPETAVRPPLPPAEVVDDAIAETAPAPSRTRARA